jgi:hypothetical protein
MSYTPITIKYSSANSTPVTLNVAEPAYSYASNTFFIGTQDSNGYIPIGGYFYIDQQAQIFAKTNSAFNKANTNNLTISLIDTGGNISNVVSNVTTLRFDSDSGFDVNSLSQGVVKVGLNSTFKYWQVNGITYLTAQGIDTVNFLPTNGISITANGSASPQTIQFDGSIIFDKSNSSAIYANSAFAAANSITANIRGGSF